MSTSRMLGAPCGGSTGFTMFQSGTDPSSVRWMVPVNVGSGIGSWERSTSSLIVVSSRSAVAGTVIANDAAEPNVGGRSRHRLGLACGRSVAEAIIGRAKVRAALDDPPRDAGARAVPAVTLHGRLDARVVRHPARLGGVIGVARGEEVRRPLPDVSRHVVEAEPVCRETLDRRCAEVAVR